MSTTSAPAVVGRSLGRAARFATVWLGAASASVESLVERARGKRSLIPPAALGAAPLIEELAALVQAQPAGESGALAVDDKFWSLVEQLYESVLEMDRTLAGESDEDRRRSLLAHVQNAEIRRVDDELKIEYPVSVPTPTQLDAFGEIDVLPTTWVIDPSGNVVKEIQGVPPGKQAALRSLVDDLLAKKKRKR